MHCVRLVVALLLTVMFFAPARSASALSVPLHIENGVLLVDATLDGVGPMLFTLDPGAGDLYTSYARERLKGRAPHTLCLASACVETRMQYFAGDPAQLLPRHDPSLGVLAGSIGPALLQTFAMRIDYRSSALTLLPASAFQPPPDAQALSLGTDAAGMPTVPAIVDGKPVLLELDVRASTSMLFTPFLENAGLRKRYAGAPVVKQSATLTAHAIQRVQIGPTELRDVAFWFSTATSGKFAAHDVAGLLGNNVLSQFTVTLDLPRRRVYFEP